MPFFEGRAGDEGGNPFYDPTVGWIALNCFAMVFGAASNIYKEIALKDDDLEIWYTNAWVGVFQLIAGFLTTWTISIQAFQDPPISFSQLPAYFTDANNCFLGILIIVFLYSYLFFFLITVFSIFIIEFSILIIVFSRKRKSKYF